MEMQTNYELLLQLYKQIWNNRELRSAGTDASIILKEAVVRELKDENSHPRVRKSQEEKFYFAIKRITASSIEVEDKYRLIAYYTSALNELRMKL
jgi:hypothetical protein